LCTYFF